VPPFIHARTLLAEKPLPMRDITEMSSPAPWRYLIQTPYEPDYVSVTYEKFDDYGRATKPASGWPV